MTRGESRLRWSCTFWACATLAACSQPDPEPPVSAELPAADAPSPDPAVAKVEVVDVPRPLTRADIRVTGDPPDEGAAVRVNLTPLCRSEPLPREVRAPFSRFIEAHPDENHRFSMMLEASALPILGALPGTDGKTTLLVLEPTFEAWTDAQEEFASAPIPLELRPACFMPEVRARLKRTLDARDFHPDAKTYVHGWGPDPASGGYMVRVEPGHDDIMQVLRERFGPAVTFRETGAIVAH